MAELMKIPAIRFKGFSGEWHKNKVGDLCDCIVPGRNKPKAFDGDIPWITTPDITNNGIIGKSKEGLAISREEAKKVGAKIVPKDSIIMSCVGELGIVAMVKNELIVNQQLHAFIPKEKLSNWFLLYGLSIRKEYMEEVATKTAVPYMNKDNCNSIPIIYPTLPEQTQIGRYFQNLDKLISLHQAKVNKLVNLKKAMLEKMFPKVGADVPKIRFKGFVGAWEEKDLGQLAKITTGSSNREDSGLDGEYTFFDRSDDIRTSNIYLFDCEAVIVAGEGSDFVPKYFVGKFDLHQRTYAIVNFDKLVGKFLYYYIYLFRKHFLDYAVGSTVKSLRLPMFKEMPVKYPTEPEQQKIGAYFQNLDSLITLHQQELNKLNNLKKACLAKMFV